MSSPEQKRREEELYKNDQQWRRGMPVSFVQPRVRELIDGALFDNIDWVSLLAEQEAKIKSTEFKLNGERRRVKTIGWQGSDNGIIGEHPESFLQEDAFVPSGHLVMTIIDKGGKRKVEEARGMLPINELEQIAFVLRVAEGEIEGQEHLALSVLANFRVDMPQLVTEQGWSHGTVIPSPSRYLIVKHEVVKLPDPYGIHGSTCNAHYM